MDNIFLGEDGELITLDEQLFNSSYSQEHARSIIANNKERREQDREFLERKRAELGEHHPEYRRLKEKIASQHTDLDYQDRIQYAKIHQSPVYAR